MKREGKTLMRERSPLFFIFLRFAKRKERRGMASILRVFSKRLGLAIPIKLRALFLEQPARKDQGGI